MTKGEQMLVDLGYEKTYVSHGNRIVFEEEFTRISFRFFGRDLMIEDETDRIFLEIEEIQAIHQCMIDYGWID